MPWEPDFIEDGDAATAAQVNALLGGAETWVNDLGSGAMRRGAFNHFTSMSLVSLVSGPFTVVRDNGPHLYSRATFGGSLDYTTFGANNGSDTTAVYTGDRTLIGHPDSVGLGGNFPARLTFSDPVKLGMDNGSRVGGLLLLCNVELERFAAGGATDLELMVCLQFKCTGNANWFTIDRTERFCHIPTHVDSTERPYIDIPIVTVLTQVDLDAAGFDPSTDTVASVRAMLSLYGSTGTSTVTLNRWRLTGLPLHCEMVL
jgi:hypothetical protein